MENSNYIQTRFCDFNILALFGVIHVTYTTELGLFLLEANMAPKPICDWPKIDVMQAIRASASNEILMQLLGFGEGQERSFFNFIAKHELTEWKKENLGKDLPSPLRKTDTYQNPAPLTGYPSGPKAVAGNFKPVAFSILLILIGFSGIIAFFQNANNSQLMPISNSICEVDGYYRKDGTWVKSYLKTCPDKTKKNNLIVKREARK